MPMTQHLWWHHIWKDYQNLGTALWLFVYFLTKIRPKKDCLKISYAHMLREIGVSKSTIKRWLAKLESTGYLHIKQSNGWLVIRLDKLPTHRKH